MPVPPPDPAVAGRPVNPARILLESPLAAARRGRVYHLRRPPPPRQRGRHVLAMVGTLLVHLFFLFAFVLGAAYQPKPSPPRVERMLQVRLIGPPEPPPPPAVRGTPPKERGPRQQGRRHPAVMPRGPNANTAAAAVDAPRVPVPATITPAGQAQAPVPKPVVATPPPVTPPAPVPLPKPVVPAAEPPALVVQIPAPLPPAPAPFQPESARPPQAEGNRPILPPAALTLPKAGVPAPANQPAMALQMDTPEVVAPVSVMPAAQPPATPEVPRLQPLSLPAPPAPAVTRQTPVLAPVRIAPQALAEPEAASMASIEPPVAPAAAASTSIAPIPVPILKHELEQLTQAPATPSSVLRPAMNSSIAVADVTPPTPAPSPAGEPLPVPAPTRVESPKPVAELPAIEADADVSRAPDAIAQGSDTAPVGEPAATSAASAPTQAATTASRPPGIAVKSTGTQGKSLAAGRPGDAQPGVLEGVPRGSVGDYVQLKPTGDTEIMRRGAPDIGYQPTRFDKDWVPADESSVDTALRRAVEKTTVKRTFHLPRGVRVECAVRPLLPIALLGCQNPDPPAVPVAEKLYDQLHLAPARPLAPAVTSTSGPPPVPAPTPMVKSDNRAECAAARLAGGPLPPGCLPDAPPVQPIPAPASSSSMWVPASDQFQ